jgi:hypothetical protein
MQAAADAVVEFALLSLGPEFLRWEPRVNLGTAALVWNAHRAGAEPPLLGTPGSAALARLMRVLGEARRTRWPDCDFQVFDLGVRHEGGDLLFTFRLTWDDPAGQGDLRTWPCEIAVAWDAPLLGPGRVEERHTRGPKL